MSLSTFSCWRSASMLLTALCLHFSTLAQTAPAWQSVSALGTTSSITATTTDASGNLYLAGYFLGSATIGGTTLTSLGSSDGFVAKFTPTGTLAWVRQLGSVNTDEFFGLVVDAAGNVYVSGSFAGTIALGNNLALTYPSSSTNTSLITCLIRYSAQGTPEWAQQGSTFSTSQGGDLGLDANGSVYLSGIYSRTLTIGSTTITTPSGGYGACLGRFSAATGQLQSLTTLCSYPNISPITVARPIIEVTPAGTVYILNDFFSTTTVGNLPVLVNQGRSDSFIAKYTPQLTLEWLHQFGGPDEDLGLSMAADASGAVYLAGGFSGPAAFGATTLPSTGGVDAYLAKYSSQGQLQWVQPGGSTGRDLWRKVALDATGAPYVTGSFEGQAAYGPYSLSSAGGTDAVVAAYTTQGQIRWVQQAGGTGTDFGRHLHFTPQGNLNVVGAVGNTSNFGPLSLAPTTAAPEYFLARLGTSVLANRAPHPQALSFYPNPATDQVQLRGLPAGTRVQVLDALGRVVRESALTPAARVSVQGLLTGLYTLRATDVQGRSFVGRLLVE